MKKENRKKILTGILGNIFEHYSTALYALLAPFISQIFFPSKSRIDGLILTYSILCLGIISRPLGALIFGIVGDALGRKKAFSIALFGSAAVCLLFSLVPSYEKIGFLAPIFIALLKSVQGFFSAGETPLGAIYVVEMSKEKSLMSSIYDASSILGIFIASFGVFILSYLNIIDNFWRILFVLGSFSAFIGLLLRKYPENSNLTKACSATSIPYKLNEIEQDTNNIPSLNKKWGCKGDASPWKLSSFDPLFSLVHIKQIINSFGDIFKIIRENFKSFVSILLISGFSYSIYYFSFIFLCGYLPLISKISESECMKINSLILLLDFFALPVVGYLAEKFSKEKLMLLASFLITISAMPLFFFLQDSSILTSTSIRILLMLLGVLFSAPLHHLAIELAPEKHRSKIVALSYAFGSQLIGLPSSAIGLFLYKKSNLVYAPGIYLSFFGLISFFILARYYFLKFKVQNQIYLK